MATLRESMKQGITAAIAAGSAPRPPSKGRGLTLAIDGRRSGLRLMDDRGDLTAAGDYYYEAMGVAPPNKRFDYTQEPTRKGPKIQIQLRDGTPATVRTWDNVNHRWRFTPVGKKYYAEA